MKDVDKINIGIIIIATIIYIVLCYQTKYRSIFYNNNQLTENEYRILYFTTVYGFIYGTVLVSFQQRYLEKNVNSVWVWIIILFLCILLTFSAFYSQIYNEDDTNSLLGKFSYAMVPILPSLVMMCESAISEIIENSVNDNNLDINNSENSFDRLLDTDDS
jgi:peptidoglycan/LPS O-acetylase OafA/YrhL